jgi:hypothetical protein
LHFECAWFKLRKDGWLNNCQDHYHVTIIAKNAAEVLDVGGVFVDRIASGVVFPFLL